MNEDVVTPKPKPDLPDWIIPSDRIEDVRRRADVGTDKESERER